MYYDDEANYEQQFTPFIQLSALFLIHFLWYMTTAKMYLYYYVHCKCYLYYQELRLSIGV